MADIEKMKINLAKNEEKLAKKVALLGKYESRKAKLSAEWEKLYGESFTDSMKKVYSLEENLSVYGKIIKYYGENAYDIYDKLYSLTRDEDYWNPINQTKKGIEELEERCQKYRDSIAEEEKKNADRKASMESNVVSVNGKDVNVIVEFLNKWEKQVTDHWMKVFDRYVAEANNWYNNNIKNTIEYKVYYDYSSIIEEVEKLWKNSEYTEYYATYEEYRKSHSYRDECCKAIRNRLDELQEEYESIFSIKIIEKYAKTRHNPKKEVFEENMRKAIAKEKNRKYDQLIEDVEHICGKIIDMSNIKIGHKGDLEGYVIGTNGEAELWTTGCGGFNENVIVNVKHGQTFHFRFYIKKRA